MRLVECLCALPQWAAWGCIFSFFSSDSPQESQLTTQASAWPSRCDRRIIVASTRVLGGGLNWATCGQATLRRPAVHLPTAACRLHPTCTDPICRQRYHRILHLAQPRKCHTILFRDAHAGISQDALLQKMATRLSFLRPFIALFSRTPRSLHHETLSLRKQSKHGGWRPWRDKPHAAEQRVTLHNCPQPRISAHPYKVTSKTPTGAVRTGTVLKTASPRSRL